jgi:hypothetical protein
VDVPECVVACSVFSVTEFPVFFSIRKRSVVRILDFSESLYLCCLILGPGYWIYLATTVLQLLSFRVWLFRYIWQPLNLCCLFRAWLFGYIWQRLFLRAWLSGYRWQPPCKYWRVLATWLTKDKVLKPRWRSISGRVEDQIFKNLGKTGDRIFIQRLFPLQSGVRAISLSDPPNLSIDGLVYRRLGQYWVLSSAPQNNRPRGIVVLNQRIKIARRKPELNWHLKCREWDLHMLWDNRILVLTLRGPFLDSGSARNVTSVTGDVRISSHAVTFAASSRHHPDNKNKSLRRFNRVPRLRGSVVR